MRTVAEIVDAFGGVKAFADTFNVSKYTVYTWRERNTLPAHLDFPISTEAAMRGLPITCETLAKMRWRDKRMAG